MHPLTRREFLALMGKGLVAAELARWLPFLPENVEAVHGEGFPLAAVAAGTNEDSPQAILKTALDGVGGLARFVKPGMAVVIKPNATWAYPPHTASSTDPELLRALIGMVREAGAGRVLVIDHCSIDPGTNEALRVSGIGKLVKEEGVEGIFPDRTNAPLSTYTSIDLPNGKAFKKIGVIKAAVEADLRINLAMTKTHNVTKMSMCLKHMMGLLQAPGRLHSNLDQGIADLSTPSPLQAQLHILEALRVRMPYGNYRVCAGPETDVTNPKVVRRWNQIVAGTDPVLIDAYAGTTFFDVAPEEIPYVVKAFESGVGAMDIKAAMQDGRVKAFQVGQPVQPEPSATPTAAPDTVTATANGPLPATPQPSTVVSTSTPLPTAMPQPDSSQAQTLGIALDSGSTNCSTQIIDARPILNTALIPAAGIVTGAGLIALSRRPRKNGEHSTPETSDGEEEKPGR